MADSISQQTKDAIADLARQGYSRAEAARRLGVSKDTTGRYWPDDGPARRSPGGANRHPGRDADQREPAQAGANQRDMPRLPDPAPEAGGPGVPEPEYIVHTAVHVDVPGWHLVLGDVHIPMHDRATIELAVKEGRDKRAAVVLLNGDIMDMFTVTPFFRPPSDDRFVDEIEKGKQFIAWIRSQFPNARIIYREGNHEFRLKRFVGEKAPELYSLPCLTLQNLLELDKHGVEWVQDKRKVLLGKLITLHGHEFRKGEGINPARLAFLRSTASVLVGHHHRTSEHHQRALDERHHAVWSVGCACYLHPDYEPYGQSNHGFAMVEVATDGWFSVQNRRVLNGRMV